MHATELTESRSSGRWCRTRRRPRRRLARRSREEPWDRNIYSSLQCQGSSSKAEGQGCEAKRSVVKAPFPRPAVSARNSMRDFGEGLFTDPLTMQVTDLAWVTVKQGKFAPGIRQTVEILGGGGCASGGTDRATFRPFWMHGLQCSGSSELIGKRLAEVCGETCLQSKEFFAAC